MRIIAGQFRSRTLQAPAGLGTRPTSDRLRETLFNVLAPRIQGAAFLDLYAGSGAAALAALRANLANLGIAEGFTIHSGSAGGWLRKAEKRSEAGAQAGQSHAFDLVFLDPPYEAAEEYAAALGLLGGEAGTLLNPGALVIAEHRGKGGSKEQLGDRYGALERTRLLVQGDAALSFYTGREIAVEESAPE